MVVFGASKTHFLRRKNHLRDYNIFESTQRSSLSLFLIFVMLPYLVIFLEEFYYFFLLSKYYEASSEFLHTAIVSCSD